MPDAAGTGCEVLRRLRREDRLSAVRTIVRGLWLPLATLAGATSASAAAFTFAPPPAWVAERELPAGAAPKAADAAGTYSILFDQQIRLHRGSTQRYLRTAYHVLNAAGLQDASEMSIDFEPPHETLEIHYARVLRGGRQVVAMTARDVKVIQQERDLDRRIYNGALTALLFMRDVRVGDIIDYAYSVNGQNPVFGGRFAGSLGMGYSFPVAEIHRRLIVDRTRTVHHRTHGLTLEPTIEESPLERTYVWSRRDVPAVVEEDDAPSWVNPYPWVQLTEFESWEQVGAWAHDLFLAQKGVSPEIRTLAAEWSAADPEARARQATRLVQDHVRYLGIELGPRSYQPHRPEEVLARRFGDCKDKSLLLVVFFDELGIDAAPALVSTRLGPQLDEWLPTPFAFDHAIVQAAIGGRTVWIDATASATGGRMTTFDQPPYRRALVLRPGTTALTAIPEKSLEQPTVVVEEAFVREGEDGARLEVTSTYRASDADSLRSSLAASSAADLSRRYLDFYAEGDGRVKALHPPKVDDRRDENVIVVREAYRLPQLWADGGRQLHAWTITDRLDRPATTLRQTPFGVSHPAYVRHRIEVDGGAVAAWTLPDSLSVGGPAFRVTRTPALAGGRMSVTWEYRSVADAVQPSDARAHLKACDDANAGAYAWVDTPVERPSGRVAIVTLSILVVLFAALVALAVASRRAGSAVGRLPPAPAGASPETAFASSDDADLARTLERERCGCGRAGGLAEVQRSGLSYGGARLTAVTARCGACGGERDLYFRRSP